MIKRASRKTIGAIPVGLKVSFGGAKVYVEAQYEISGKVVIYLIGEGKKTIAKVDGSVSGKTLAKSMLYNYIINNTANKKFFKTTTGRYNWQTKKRDEIKTPIDIEKVIKAFKSNSSKFIDELYTEVNVANGKGRNKVSTNMAIKNKVAASRKSRPKKAATKKAATKKATGRKTFSNKTGSKKVNLITDATGMIRAMYVQVYNGQEQVLDSKSYSSIKMAEKWAKSKLGIISKPTTTKRAAKKVTPKKAAKKSTAKGNEGNLVYVGTGTKGAKKVYQYAYKKITKKK